jgi:DNA-binding NtrC family response regulator
MYGRDDEATRRFRTRIPTHPPGWKEAPELRAFSMEPVDAGADVFRWTGPGDRCAIGAHPSNDLVLTDETVSRFHCELHATEDGVRVVDLGSRNGTVVDGLRVRDAWLKDGSLVRFGAVALRFRWSEGHFRVPAARRDRFGSLVGSSPRMRAVFAMLERFAASDATVLVEGETGTGKQGAAEALHEEGARAGGPFVVVDCGAVPATLIESELFGHERGAFTGAETARRGAFAAADGGTLFLDEIGELPLELQPKLLRVLEQRTVRPLGAVAERRVNVRVVAATNRDLRAEVNAGRFRPDLYYRLAVLKVDLPPLRERTEDLPLLVSTLLGRMEATVEERARLTAPEFLEQLRWGAWPGNVRELRNYLERARVVEGELSPPPARDSSAPPAVDPTLPYAEARRRALAAFERAYASALLERHGSVAAAARAAGITRVYLHRLLRRHGVKD